MSLDFITSLFQFQLLFKAIVMVAAAFYVVLLIVIAREINLMTQTLNSSINPLIKLVAVIQIFLVIGLFFLAVFLL